MATSRTTAQRRRAKALARDTAYAHTPAVALSDDAATDEEPWDEDDVVGRIIPRWPWIAGIILCLLGLGVAAYLTYDHYTATPLLACPENATINCGKVTTSVYSHILGIPVAVLGLVFFAGMLPLQLPMAWRSPSLIIRGARLAGAVIGVGMILWLVYAELFKIDAICLYCTSVHILTFLLFVVIAFGTIATAESATG